MEKAAGSKSEVIMAGVGGMGVMVAGQVLAHAALPHYKHVSWVPSYAVQKRGGDCHCTVILSNEPIASPILDQTQSILLFDASQLVFFESRVRPGGLLIIEQAGLRAPVSRKDINVLPIAGLEQAVRLGDALVNNLILLGVYIAKEKALPAEVIEAELEKTYEGKEERLALNKGAFRQGLELATMAS